MSAKGAKIFKAKYALQRLQRIHARVSSGRAYMRKHSIAQRRRLTQIGIATARRAFAAACPAARSSSDYAAALQPICAARARRPPRCAREGQIIMMPPPRHRSDVASMAYMMLTFDSHAGTLSSPISTRPKTSTTRWAAGRRSRDCSRRTRRRSVDGRRSASGRRRNTASSTGCSRRKCSRAWWPCSTK